VSLGGARVIVEDGVAPGEIVALSLTAPTLWDPLLLRARIVWVHSEAPPGPAGLAFEHGNADAVFALYELIATLAYE
jgi:hypothetical protein